MGSIDLRISARSPLGPSMGVCALICAHGTLTVVDSFNPGWAMGERRWGGGFGVGELDRTGEFGKRSLKQYSFFDYFLVSVRFTFSETRQTRGTCRHQ